MGRIIDGRGYALVRLPDHPRSHSNGYVFEHLLVAEHVLGRALRAGVDVHHVNGVRDDNRNCNLVICESRAYHMLLHVRERILAEGGHPGHDKICTNCGKLLPKTEFTRDRSASDGLGPCRPCTNAKWARYYKRARAA